METQSQSEPIAYTVTATLPSAAVREAYMAWLLDGHVQAVVAGGAASARVIRIDEPEGPPKAQACYVFPSRRAFEIYLRVHAPALRADGQRRFPPESGVSFERQVGVMVGSVGEAGR